VAQPTIELVARGSTGQALTPIREEWPAKMPGPALAIPTYAVLFHLTLPVSGVVGLFLRRSRGLLWLLLPVPYFMLLIGPVEEARFRVPVKPLLCLFAAAALTRLPETSNDSPQGAHAI